MDIKRYMDNFVSEAEEHLQTLNQSLLELEKDPSNADVINQLFRSAHTIKGTSATMGFNRVSDLAHEMEDVLDKLRSGETEATPELIDMLLKCVDVLEASIKNLSAGGEELDTSATSRKLKEILLGAEPKIEKGPNTFLIKVVLDRECQTKSVRKDLILGNLSRIGRVIKTVHESEEEFSIGLSTEESMEKVEGVVRSVSEIERVEVSAVAEEGLEDLLQKAEEVKGEEEAKEEIGVVELARKATIKSIQSIKVPVERLDTLVNLTGELITIKNRLRQLQAMHDLEAMRGPIDTLDRLTSDIQNGVMQARMIPVEHIFNRFPRMVRDLAREERKKVNFIVEGSEIELDRTVLDRIGEPLVHLLRNAVDHGVEPPKDRREMKKPETGTIKLTARRERDYAVIEISDDGAGIDVQQIKKVAIEKGIISKEDGSKLEDKDAIWLMFEPGFSTSEKVTGASGRGVGLDTVKMTVESLGGVVDVETEVGKGSKFTLQLPLSLAIIQSLLVRVGEETYALPLSNVGRVVHIGVEEIKTIQNQKTMLLAGEIIPLVVLHELFDIPSKGKRDLTVLIVERGRKRMGLIVDSIVGEQEIIIKPLDTMVRKASWFSGTSILPNGRIVLILDASTLI